MSLDVHATVRACADCPRERISLRKHANYLKLFPATTPLEFVSIDILGELKETPAPRNNRYLLVITDRYSKLTRVVPLKRITAYTVAKAFCESWVFVYGPPFIFSQITEDSLLPSILRPCAQYWEFGTCSRLRITHRRTDKLNGLTERSWPLCAGTSQRT